VSIPLRWIHFHEGPEGAGVYVHIADLLHMLDTYGWERVRTELEALLDDRLISPAPPA
jgi:hypothetical protein